MVSSLEDESYYFHQNINICETIVLLSIEDNVVGSGHACILKWGQSFFDCLI